MLLGMQALIHIDLPGWNKEGLPALKKRCEELALQPRGTRGNREVKQVQLMFDKILLKV